MKHKKGGKVSDRKKKRRVRKQGGEMQKAKPIGVNKQDKQTFRNRNTGETVTRTKSFEGAIERKGEERARKYLTEKGNKIGRPNLAMDLEAVHPRAYKNLSRSEVGLSTSGTKRIERREGDGPLQKKMKKGMKGMTVPKKMPGGGKMPKYMAGGKVYKTGGSMISALAKNPKMRAQMKRELGM